MTSVFLTGFPGFLGSELVQRLLARYEPAVTINCLVQGAYRPQAEARKAEIEASNRASAGRIRLVDGDITLGDLGLGERLAEMGEDTREIYHLAAVYDLGVKRDLAMRVNVTGTRNVLNFAHRCPRIQRVQYVSTCYVSGSHRGPFTEFDLARGQHFNNYYEETKYLAECEVQDEMDRGMPCTIYRPSVVVGDSRTGVTQKYDGPYYLMQWLLRNPRGALVPVLGNPKKVEFNLVPRDFVVDALAHLSALRESEGKVYQLADPHPPSVDELIDILAEATAVRAIRVPVPESLATWSLRTIKPLRDWMRIEPATVHYFSHPTRYTSDNTVSDLRGSGIACPRFADYAARLVAFMRQHPEISPKAMV